jgi:type IX secretion system PorP/SprF family membrane protein
MKLFIRIGNIVGVLSWSVLFSLTAYAQQDPLYGLYINNPLVINPAYTGINNNLAIFTGYRNQWAGFDGNPATLYAGGHLSLLQNKMAAGLTMVSDRIGENNNTQLTASYTYKLSLGEAQTLSFGMQAGFINYKVDPSSLLLEDITDNSFSSISQTKPTFGAGLMLKSDRYLLGLSVPRLVNGSFEIGGQEINVYQQHYYLLGSYLFFLSERIILKPSVLLKAVSGTPVSADMNVNFILDRNYSVGIYTRNLNAYGLMAQISFLDKFRVSYALEVPTNKSVGTRFTTNEVMLSISTAALGFHDHSQSGF